MYGVRYLHNLNRFHLVSVERNLKPLYIRMSFRLLISNLLSFLITIKSFNKNAFVFRAPSSFTTSSTLLSSSADLRKNIELYNEFGTEISVTSSTVQKIFRDPNHKSGKLTKPEILAPAGGWSQLIAAVVNGADAVYFGLQDGFNARARASNFPIEELPTVMNYLHDRDVKGYLVVNILVFDEEIDRLKALIPKIALAGVDALIMQDIGAVALVHALAPNLPIHGSTQMSITDARGVDFTQRLNAGIDRIVVGRELSIAEIASISQDSSVELEAFVHGALCVSYSGQCYSSEAWGGRSANRGQCAQACRMPYGLIVNGTLTNMIDDAKYLLSPQDLMALDLVPDLIKAGVKSFKIEGRLKGPEYVAITTKAYREAVDTAWDLLLAGREVDFQGPGEAMRRDLRQVFARGQDEKFDGLSQGFLNGVQHQSLVRGRSPRHRGNMIGRVIAVTKNGVEVDVINPIKRGDGLAFDRNKPEEDEEGGTIYEIFDTRGTSVGIGSENEVTSGRHTLTFGQNAINYSRIRKGNLVWKNKDSHLDARLKAFVARGDMQLVDVKVTIIARIGNHLTIEIMDNEGRIGKGVSEVLCAQAAKKPIGLNEVSKAIGLLGDTPFRLSEEDIDTKNIESNVFLPSSEIKVARRRAVEDLIAKRREHSKADGLQEHTTLFHPDTTWTTVQNNVLPPITPELSLLCRNPNQVTAACAIPWLKEICLDFLEVHGIREAVAAVRKAGKKVVVATPRVLKPDEQRLWTFYLRLRPDALLVRSAGFLQQMLDLGGPGSVVNATNSTIPELYGDFSLNAANVPASKIFLGSGLTRLSPTHDLNAVQIADLVIGLEDKGHLIDCIIHQHLPIFHTEHCVFCRFLSNGNSYKDCGHPCESNNVDLRDMNGQDHIVLADMGCRNTVFNAKAQSGAEYMGDLIEAGVKRFRIELVDEDPSSIEILLTKYRNIIHSKRNRDEAVMDLLEWLKFLPNRNGQAQGVGTGSLRPSAERNWDTLKPTAGR